MKFAIFGLGGKKEKEFLYEPMLLTEAIAAGFVPCTIDFSGKSDTTCAKDAYLTITRTGGTDKIGSDAAVNQSWAGANGDYVNWGQGLMNYDLESYYKGNYALMETITDVSCTSKNSSRVPVIRAIRYYKKSSGGGS